MSNTVPDTSTFHLSDVIIILVAIQFIRKIVSQKSIRCVYCNVKNFRLITK